MCYDFAMVKTLEHAILQITSLPEADQEEIGRKLLAHVEKLRKLRKDVDAGLASLRDGQGVPLDVEAFLLEMNRRRGRA
jgi:hypothetical protein